MAAHTHTAIPISDKADLKPMKGNKRQWWTLYNDNEDNTSRRYTIYKYIYMYTQHRSTKTHKASINRPKEWNWQQHNDSTPHFING